MIRFYSLLIVFILCLTSCSTIFNGSYDDVNANSNPSDAKIFVNGMEIGKTPAILRLQRGETHIIEIKKEGFKEYRIQTNKSITGWFWGNLLCGGLLGLVFDLATGNAYDIEPHNINAILSKDTAFNGNFNLENYNGIDIRDNEGKYLGEVQIVWE